MRDLVKVEKSGVYSLNNSSGLFALAIFIALKKRL